MRPATPTRSQRRTDARAPWTTDTRSFADNIQLTPTTPRRRRWRRSSVTSIEQLRLRVGTLFFALSAILLFY